MLRSQEPYEDMYFGATWSFKCPAGCQPAGTLEQLGASNALRAANPQVLWSHLELQMPCGLPIRRYFGATWSFKCPAGCQPAGTLEQLGASNALRAANPQVLWSHLELQMPCGLPTRRYFGATWSFMRAANPQVLWSHLELQMPCGLPTRRYFGATWSFKCPAGCQPAGTLEPLGASNALRAANPQVLWSHLELQMPCGLPTCRYFGATWSFKCPAGCQPAGTLEPLGASNALRAALEPLGASNALRAANPQVLWSHLELQMPCGLPTRRYFGATWSFKCPAGCQPAGTLEPLGASCGLPTRRYFGATWSFKCPAGCQPAGTLEPLGASNAQQAANPQVLWSYLELQMPCGLPTRKYFGATLSFKCPAGCQPAGTLEPLGASNALRAANPQVLWSHLELQMPCGLPTRRYFGATWSFKCPAGCQPAGTLEPLGASNAQQAANPQVLWSHLELQMPCGLPTRRYFGATWSFKCPAGCQPAGTVEPLGASNALRAANPAGTLEPLGASNALRAANPQVLWSHLELHAGCQPAGTLEPLGASNALRAANPQVLESHLELQMPCGLPTRRYFGATWSFKCPAGCQPAGTLEPLGASNALRAANPQVLWSHLELQMPCGLLWSHLELQMPCGLRQSSHLELQMPCGLPTRRYFGATWSFKCPAGCQPAGTLEPLGASNALLRSHLELQMPCGLPTRRYFGATWSFKCPAGCQPAGTLEPLGASNALRAANPQVLWSHLEFQMPCGLPTRTTRSYFGATESFKCPAGCQPAGTLEPLGTSNALRAANPHNPQVLWSHLELQMPAGCQPAGTLEPLGASNALRAANPHNPQVLVPVIRFYYRSARSSQLLFTPSVNCISGQACRLTFTFPFVHHQSHDALFRSFVPLSRSLP